MKNKDILVGIDYFTGWWRPLPNFWVKDGLDWREKCPERVPLLGEYNDQETMDREIDAASSHGVDFFLVLWYPYSEVINSNFAMLNNGIKQFMSSKNAYKMKFAMEYCNHEPYPPLDDDIWDRQCHLWCDFMRHPSYLYIGGKAFFKIHGILHFLAQHGQDGKAAARRIRYLRKVAKDTGIGEILVCAGAVGDEPIQGALADVLVECDCHGTYGELPEVPKRDEPYPYEMLLEVAQKRWQKSVDGPFLPYIPSIMCGWEPSPWKDSRAGYYLPDKEQWKTALEAIKRAVDENPVLRVPDGTKQGQKIFTIYAWNEFGEGGFMAPTRGDRYMKLEAVKEVFGVK